MTILITRPSPAGEALVEKLNCLGMRAYHSPLITFRAGNDLNHLPDWLTHLRPNDCVIAASPQAVQYAAAYLHQQKITWPNNLAYFAIGNTTATALAQATQCYVHRPQGREISEQLLTLPQLQQVNHHRIVILRGNGGRELLQETLRQRGASVRLCECYQRTPIPYNGAEICHDWQQHNVDTLVITSGEMLQRLVELVPSNQHDWLFSCRLMTVSERLAAQAKRLGWLQCIIADNANNDALVRAIQHS